MQKRGLPPRLRKLFRDEGLVTRSLDVNESESVDLIRIALISFIAGESYEACALAALSKPISTKRLRRFPVEARYCVSGDDEVSAGRGNDCRRLLGNYLVIAASVTLLMATIT